MNKAILITICSLIFASCAEKNGKAKETSDKIRVFLSILPQSYLVERIGGEYVDVRVLVQFNQNPHTFEITPRQMAAMSEADIFFTIGLPFEDRITDKITSVNPKIKILPSDKDVKKIEMAGHHHEEREIEEHIHGNAAYDPHIWLSPSNLKIIAANIALGLAELKPEKAEQFQQNYLKFTVESDSVNNIIIEKFKPIQGAPVFIFHPVLGYFCGEYSLKQYPVEIEGKSPSPKELEGLVEEVRMMGIRVLFVQPQFDKRPAQIIADAAGCSIKEFNPLEKDILKNLIFVSEIISDSAK
ncbi:zinc ABC transporter substrate-binding protein [bacterium]|nr:zinc ABC transporter substrate-binding protein [bacterium]